MCRILKYRQWIAVSIACAGLFLALLPLHAQEEKAEPTSPGREPAPADAQKKDGTAADGDLFKKLTGGGVAGAAPKRDLLEEAIAGMRQAQTRIVRKDAGAGTRGIQQKVVDDLDKLIQQLKQQARSAAASSGAGNPSDDESKQPGSQSPQPAESNAGEEGTTSKDKSPESTDKIRQAEDRKAAPVPKDRMGRDVWGHLPPTVRKQLLNVYKDKYLPKYDDLVRRYFEALAEEGREHK